MSRPNAQQIEVIRVSLLKYIRVGNGDITNAYLAQFLRNEGFRSLDEATLGNQLQFLERAGLIEETPSLLGAGVKHWRITDSGVDHLAQMGE